VITPVLPAGRYIVFASTNDTQIYPATNTMDVKTVQGSEGSYGVRLTESAPPPVITALTLRVTLTAWARVGARKRVVLTVKR
jgi:hypothetical protein